MNKAKLLIRIVKLLRRSHKLYARATREKDTELLYFLDEIFELAEAGIRELNAK